MEEKKPEVKEPKKLTEQEIISLYTKAKRQYTAFFQKTIEFEDELSGIKLVLNTLSKLNDNRRCFRKIGGVLVEKDLPSVKKDLEVELSNFKATLDTLYKAMDQQEAIMIDYEKKYPEILRPNSKKAEEKKEEGEKKAAGGVLYFSISLLSLSFSKLNFALDQFILFLFTFFNLFELLFLLFEVFIFLSKLFDFDIGIVMLLFLAFEGFFSFLILFVILL